MRILVAIVHHWNPKGSGRHASLRPDPNPRKYGLQSQLLALRRLAHLQGTVDFSTLKIKPVNNGLGHVIDVKVITDGTNSVLELLDERYSDLYEEVVTNPENSLKLGFEAQVYLASQLDKKYDFYCYMEDDLVIHDPLFFHKISWLNQELGNHLVILPHRMEFYDWPNQIDKLYIDGPVPENDLASLIPNPPKPFLAGSPAGKIRYESPLNPHAGCFFLTHSQLKHWTKQTFWQDGDTSYVSPLESAATLGIAKTFTLYKPAFEYAAWLELQHWGTSFICMVRSQSQKASSANTKNG